MKIIIIINTIIPFFACVQCMRALLIAYSTRDYVRRRSIRFELAEDKQTYEKAVRFYMYLVLASNIILFLWNVSRMVNNWAPYATMFITVTSILFNLILFCKAQLLLMFHRGNGGFKYFKHLNI